MKKQNLNGKLNLKKDLVSNLDKSNVYGGGKANTGLVCSNHCTYDCSFLGGCGTTGPAPFTVHIQSDCACQ
ncbi:class I lanthipeptide [Kordia sp.]|uniref:class I lanthipeptide n=1 Tax=Kordia sp. TaxID=1965332 RepID=UPI003D6C4A5F